MPNGWNVDTQSPPALIPMRNGFLRSFGLEAREALSPFLKPVHLTSHRLLLEVGRPVEQVYFPTTALVSVIETVPDRRPTESFLVGPEGAIGLVEVLGSGEATQDAIVCVHGEVYAIDSHEFTRITHVMPAVLRVAHLYIQHLVSTLHQRAACITSHSMESRLAAILLRCAGPLGSGDFQLTSFELAQMLGAPTAPVATAMGVMMAKGALAGENERWRLGNLRILQDYACECHTVEAAAYAQTMSRNRHSIANED